MRRLIIGLFSAIVLFVLFVVLCTFVRRPYEAILLDRFGNLIRDNQQVRIMYNWYFKLPTDNVVRIDNRLHLYTGPLQQVVTALKDPISIRTFAAWRIVDPVKFYQKTGGSDQRALAIMDQKLRGLVQAKLAAHQLDELFNTDEARVHTASIEQDVAREASEGSSDPSLPGGKTSGLLDQGLQIAEIGFSRIAFPPSNAESVYQRMVAELNTQARQYESDGQKEAAIIRSNGEKEAAETRSTALAQADKIRGEGEGAALAILDQAQSTPAAREFYQYWKSLEIQKSIFAKNTILVLSTNNDWLRSLFQVPQNGQFSSPATQPGSAVSMPLPPLLNPTAGK